MVVAELVEAACEVSLVAHKKLHDATPAEINDDLMVLHAPAALYGAKVSQ